VSETTNANAEQQATPTATETVKAATPTATPTATPSPTPSPTIPLSPEEYRRLLDKEARLTEIEAESRRVAEEKEAARLKALAEKGQAEDAIRQLREAKDAEIIKERERASNLEREILDGQTAVAISTALDGIDWVSEKAARDARKILEGRFETVRDASGAKRTVEKGTGRPAADVIKEWRASDDSAHYVKANTEGGAGARGTNHTASPVATESDPIAAQLRKIVAARKTGAPGLAGTYGNN
jgi:hypothetical protein